MNFWLGLPDASVWVPERLSKLASREFSRFIQCRLPPALEGTVYLNS
ncbi:hypothetical protein [Paenibacillus sp. 1011MAR3C5]|nr:hypothetical protein [Paenibacillus sp. 1011MAR3C5]